PNDAPAGPGSREALQKFMQVLGIESPLTLADELPVERRQRFDPAPRQQRQVEELERHVQRLVRASDATRDRFFSLNPAPGSASPQGDEARRETARRRLPARPGRSA